MKLNLITKEIEQILLDVAPCSFDESSETNVITAVLEKAKSRNHIDITDRLWMVLTCKCFIFLFPLKSFHVNV